METKRHSATGEDKTMKTLRDPAPETVEIYKSLKIQCSGDENLGNVFVKVWRGRQSKPYAYFSFRSVERREKYIENQKRDEDMKIEFDAKRKAERVAAKEEGRTALKVGTVLYTSWGYDQTNVDFYEVTERPTRASAIVRAIGAKTVKGSEGFMCCQYVPLPGEFVKNAEPMRKTINGLGVTIDGHFASVTDPKQEHYSSWYA